MKRSITAAMILAVTLLAGCAVSREGVSLSESQWVDNNCTGNGFIRDEDWCRERASMGPYSN